MKNLKHFIDRSVEIICIFLLAAMTLLVTYQVIMRYCFNSPSTFSEVLAKYLFVWLVMICSAYVFGLREHMNIGVFRDKLPIKLRLIVEIISEITVLIFAWSVMVVGGSTGAIRQMIQLDSALEIPIGLIYMIIPVSGLLISFYFIYNQIQLFSELANCTKKTKAKGV